MGVGAVMCRRKLSKLEPRGRGRGWEALRCQWPMASEVCDRVSMSSLAAPSRIVRLAFEEGHPL